MPVSNAMPGIGMNLLAHRHIDGISVDDVLQDVFDHVELLARNRGVALHFDVITWRQMVVAVDRSAFASALEDMFRHVVSSTREGDVALKVCLTHDDASVMFEISNSTPARRQSDLVAGLYHATAHARKSLEGMGCRVTEYGNAQGGTRVIIDVPHWV